VNCARKIPIETPPGLVCATMVGQVVTVSSIRVTALLLAKMDVLVQPPMTVNLV